jgi:hypothetical protein
VIDAKVIEASKRSIDLASYYGQRCGTIVVRIVLDPRKRHDFVKLGDLSDNVGIERGGPFRHLKAYEIDGALLRSVRKLQRKRRSAEDNDLVAIWDTSAATTSKRL